MYTEREPLYSERQRQPRNDIEELYRSWGVFDLLHRTVDQLPPAWLRILNISRNLLEGKPVPGIRGSNTLRALTERNVKIDYEKLLVTRRWREPTELPSSEIDVRPIETLSELPKVLPPYLLLADIAPDLFTYKALSGDLPVSEYRKPKVVMAEKSDIVEELEEVRSIGSSMRQKVYILQDVSLSMGDSYKLIFAKAVIMAYMVKAYEEHAQIYFRPFAGFAGVRVDCVRPSQFPELAHYVLAMGRYSDTNIALALQTAITDIRDIDQLRGDRLTTTEIFLITDGASHTDIPGTPRNITLHTLHLNDGTEEAFDYAYGGYSYKAYVARIAELAQTSKTFTEINTSSLRFPPADKETWLLKEEVGKLEQELSSKDLGNAKNDTDLNNRIKKAKQMSTAYKKMYGDRHGLKDTERKAKKMEFRLSPKGVKQAIKDALSSRRSTLKRLKGIKTSRNPQQSGTLFDFRIKRDKFE